MTLRPNVSKGCWKNSSDRLTVAQGDHKPLILRLKQNKQKPKQGVSRSACDYLTLKNTRLVFFFKCCFSCKYILLCYKAPVSYFFHSTICLKNLSVLLVAGYVQCSFSDIDNEFRIFAFISPAPCPARKLELSSPHRGLQPRSLSVAPMGCQDVCVWGGR